MGPGCQKGTQWAQDRIYSPSGMEQLHYFNNCRHTSAWWIRALLKTLHGTKRVAAHVRSSALPLLRAEPLLQEIFIMPFKTFILINLICINKWNQMHHSLPIIILSLIMVGDLSRHVERTNNCKEGENALKISKKKKKKKPWDSSTKDQPLSWMQQSLNTCVLSTSWF